VSKTHPAYVLTFGNLDEPSLYGVGRVFTLHEFDFFYPNSNDRENLHDKRSILISSIFFTPAEHHQLASKNDDEEHLRQAEAVENWIRAGKPAFGLALPGTSGSGVFMREASTGEFILVGVVTSFSRLGGGSTDDAKTILENPQSAHNKYQTIFALFYQQENDKIDTTNISLIDDPNIREMISAINEAPHKEPSWWDSALKWFSLR
jgi:hypothetical protein